ncbi:hypothetical protein LP419_31790 [Massilia sp. H-1]|nr:hypothetical protein LP419_31790 [Massilia sp. H-1]
MTALVLMRQNVMSSFAEYAVNIELDRLDELSGTIAALPGAPELGFLAARRERTHAMDRARAGAPSTPARAWRGGARTA